MSSFFEVSLVFFFPRVCLRCHFISRPRWTPVRWTSLHLAWMLYIRSHSNHRHPILPPAFDKLCKFASFFLEYFQPIWLILFMKTSENYVVVFFSSKHVLQFDRMHSFNVCDVYLHLLTRLTQRPGIDIDGLSLPENRAQ